MANLRNAIQAEAENIFRLSREQFHLPNQPPVPVEMIARLLFALECEVANLGHARTSILGKLIVNERKILIDHRCHRNQYSFVIAHEIGHWVLHEGHSYSPLSSGENIVPLSHILGSTTARTKKAELRHREFEADLFAALLLVPTSLLKNEIEYFSHIDSRSAIELAQKFCVSRQVMLRRLLSFSQSEITGPEWDKGSLESYLKECQGFPEMCMSLELQKEHRTSIGAIGVHRVFNNSLQTNPKRQTRSERKLFRQIVDFVLPSNSGESTLGRLDQSSVESRKGELFSSKKDTVLPMRLTITEPSPVNELSFARYFRRLRRKQIARGQGKRPTIIEFAGTSNAGKDTLINIIRDYLEDAHDYKVRVIYESIKTDCNLNKELYAERVSTTAAHVVGNLYEAFYENPGNCDFVLFNRGLFDTMVYSHAIGLERKISKEFQNATNDYLLSKAHLQDITILFLISPDEAIRREWETRRTFVEQLFHERDKRVGEDTLAPQGIINQNNLSKLNASYLSMHDLYNQNFKNSIYLFQSDNGRDFTIMEKARGVAEIILPRNQSRKSTALQPRLPQLDAALGT